MKSKKAHKPNKGKRPAKSSKKSVHAKKGLKARKILHKVKPKARAPVKSAPKRQAAMPQTKKEEEVKVENKNIDIIVKNVVFTDYMIKNVGKRAVDMVQYLNETPQTDDKLALKMNLKVNEVRRMLNVLNSYSITRYDINKDNKGWLTFKWYLDRDKLRGFNTVISERESTGGLKLQDNCNDFFFCETCYKEEKVILPFDAAFETGFKCECSKPLSVLNKQEVVQMFKEANAEQTDGRA